MGERNANMKKAKCGHSPRMTRASAICARHILFRSRESAMTYLYVVLCRPMRAPAGAASWCGPAQHPPSPVATADSTRSRRRCCCRRRPAGPPHALLASPSGWQHERKS